MKPLLILLFLLSGCSLMGAEREWPGDTGTSKDGISECQYEPDTAYGKTDTLAGLCPELQ